MTTPLPFKDCKIETNKCNTDAICLWGAKISHFIATICNKICHTFISSKQQSNAEFVKKFIGFCRDSAMLCFVDNKDKIRVRDDHEYLKTIPILQILNCIVDCNVVDAQNDLI